MCDENPFNSLPTNYIGMIAQCPYLLKGSLKKTLIYVLIPHFYLPTIGRYGYNVVFCVTLYIYI